MKETKAATRGMLVNPAYCCCALAKLATAAVSSTPPAVNSLIAPLSPLQTLILPCSFFSPNPSYPSSAQMPRLRDHLSPGTMSHTTKQTPETKDHRYSAPPARSSALQLAESRSAPKKQLSARVKVQNDHMRILDKQAQHGIATYPVSLCNALFV
jgi:hypothetical protein